MTKIFIMKIIIGLGNPGKEYKNTRHNTGFFLLDKIKEKYAFPEFEFNKKLNSEISSIKPPLLYKERAGGEVEKIILVKPQTFMNLSGEAVKNILSFYKLTPDDIIVIHDDIDLPVGKYKIAQDSSSAGHNGVQNIIDAIGTQKFRRIKIGVGNANLRSKISPEDFVLQKFSEEEMEEIKKISEDILEEIKKLL